VHLDGKFVVGNLGSNQFGLTRLERRHRKADAGNALVNAASRLQEPTEVVFHFLRPRAGQNGHKRPFRRTHMANERIVELFGTKLVEIRMSDICGVATSFAVPSLFKRQLAQDVVDEPSHLSHAPACPGPHLRRTVVKDGNAMRFGPPGDPPVEAGVIDQDHRIRAVVAKISVGSAREPPKTVQVDEHAGEPHHGELREVLVQFATGCGHAWAPVADALAIRASAAKLANEIRAVQITAWFSDGEEDFHPTLPRTW
jgi:hypothetical protein